MIETALKDTGGRVSGPKRHSGQVRVGAGLPWNRRFGHSRLARITSRLSRKREGSRTIFSSRNRLAPQRQRIRQN